jgi:hypothetical protein
MRRASAFTDLGRLVATPAGTGFLLAALGLAVWVGLSVIGGFGATEAGFRLREAWDTAAYFYVGAPIMALAMAAVGFFRPERAWRWPLWLVGGHQLGVMLVGLGVQSAPSLLLLTVMLGIVLTALLAIPAFAGATVGRMLAERAY